MKVIDSIRIQAGKRALKKELISDQKRHVKVCNIADATAIGLLYKIESKESVEHLRKFAKYIKSEFGTKNVFMMGYWDDAKESPDFLQVKVDFEFFTKKELNWAGIPKGGNIDNFLNESFDILIDMNNYLNVPLRYLVAKSNAKLKVGQFSKENEPYFDIMIGDNSMDFENYCNELIKYLSMIKA
ncbi:DUF6913 domain-containing protein [Parvicella tangerina]|uniref:Uncharacterized protein n=1 Tax=Parvicella tangerina TaxID=2829795 RepID=A0A916JNS8_9FLAO|nr:hypothetical protein [Parvicella tangerina]CAG5084009.1 hypothetical protein CRYO30217_02352 [Parvicella tangerina]